MPPPDMPLPDTADDCTIRPTVDGEWPAAGLPSAASSKLSKQEGPSATAFGAPFWFTYGANTSLMIAVSLLYRYDDFVRSLGGDEFQLGLIVGAGMVGSLLMRTGQGVAIDVYGSRKVWLVSAATVVVCSAGHLLVSSADSPLIFALRIALQTGIAGFFGASISYVSGRAPVEHVVEVVGTLGTSGFIGTVLGTLLGDRLLGADKEPTMMFVAASTIGCLAFVFGLLATEGAQRPMSRRRPPLTWLLRRYHPGPMLLMGVAAGFGLGIPTIYVRPFSVELGIPGIAWFFFPYMAVAFTTRLSIRRMPARFGLRPVVLVGVLCLTLGMLSFVAVQKDWHFLLPALSMGIAHAIMFPTVVAGGSTAFPARYRGLGTTVMLATFDLGSFLAFVSVGAIIVQARAAGWPAYGTMFTCVAALLATSGIVYFRWSRPKRTI